MGAISVHLEPLRQVVNHEPNGLALGWALPMGDRMEAPRDTPLLMARQGVRAGGGETWDWVGRGGGWSLTPRQMVGRQVLEKQRSPVPAGRVSVVADQLHLRPLEPKWPLVRVGVQHGAQEPTELAQSHLLAEILGQGGGEGGGGGGGPGSCWSGRATA